MSSLQENSLAIDTALDSICEGLLKSIHDDADMDNHAQSVDFLRRVQDRLNNIIDKEDRYIAEYIASQEEFIKRLKNRFNKNDVKNDVKPSLPQSVTVQPVLKTEEEGWNIVARKKRILAVSKTRSRLLGSALSQMPINNLAPETLHELAPGVMLPSRSIRTPEECHAHVGMVCWEQASKRFWFSLNGYAISFSMGNVWWAPQDLKKPIKTTEFDPEKYCHPADVRNYYFPPEIEYNITHPCNDQRNFTTIATYCPMSVEADHPSLRVSDKSNLREDIINAKPQDIRYAADYHSHGLGALIAMHLLCK